MTTGGKRRRAAVVLAMLAGLMGMVRTATDGAVAGASGVTPPRTVGHWLLDGNALDATGKGHDGTIVGAVPIPNGVTGGAYRFDGNDRIDLGAFDWVFADGEYSLSLWVRTDRAGVQDDYRMMVSKLNVSTGTGPLHVGLGDGRPIRGACGDSAYLQLWDGFGTLDAPPICNLSVNVRDGSWHMVTVTVTPAERSLFVDGDRVARHTSPITVPQAGWTMVRLGGVDFGVNSPWIGDLDEVLLVNRALRRSEVRNLYETVAAR